MLIDFLSGPFSSEGIHVFPDIIDDNIFLIALCLSALSANWLSFTSFLQKKWLARLISVVVVDINFPGALSTRRAPQAG